MQIEISKLTHGKVRNLSGHERGVKARELFGLDGLDVVSDPVDVMIPDDLDAIASSFFQGMFADSVRQFDTNERFLEHYRFRAKPVIIEQVLRGIDRIRTKRGSAFAN